MMEDTNIFEYVLFLVWMCLSLPASHLINPKLGELLLSMEFVEGLMNSSLIIMAPGLLEALHASAPPTIAWFKSLSSIPPTNHWGVYVLTLEKPDSRPELYIGSGTNSRNGIKKRFSNYDNQSSLPTNVKAALADGFIITHKGLLCSFPIPPLGARLVPRALALALEAAFAIVFSALETRTHDYGMPHLCRWSLDDFEYDGLCSHSSLNEGIRGEEEGFTPAELAVWHAERLAREAAGKKARYFSFKENDFEGWKSKRRQYDSKRDIVEKRATQKKVALKNKATDKYHCKTCVLSFHGQGNLNDHLDTQKHKDMVKGIKRVVKNPKAKAMSDAAKAAKTFYCAPCKFAGGNEQKFDSHCMSQAHEDKAGWSLPNPNAGKHNCPIPECKFKGSTPGALIRHNKGKEHKARAAAAAEAASSNN
jgi:hypothetical protein